MPAPRRRAADCASDPQGLAAQRRRRRRTARGWLRKGGFSFASSRLFGFGFGRRDDLLEVDGGDAVVGDGEVEGLRELPRGDHFGADGEAEGDAAPGGRTEGLDGDVVPDGRERDGVGIDVGGKVLAVGGLHEEVGDEVPAVHGRAEAGGDALPVLADLLAEVEAEGGRFGSLGVEVHGPVVLAPRLVAGREDGVELALADGAQLERRAVRAEDLGADERGGVRRGLHAENGVRVASAHLVPLVRLDLPELADRTADRNGDRGRGRVVGLDKEGLQERSREDVRVERAADLGRTAGREIRRGEFKVRAHARADDACHVGRPLAVVSQRRRQNRPLDLRPLAKVEKGG